MVQRIREVERVVAKLQASGTSLLHDQRGHRRLTQRLQGNMRKMVRGNEVQSSTYSSIGAGKEGL